MSDNLTPEMINQAEANIREDFRAGRISREQFQKEMLIVARARKYTSPSKQEDSADGC